MTDETRRHTERKQVNISVRINVGHGTLTYAMTDISRDGAGFRGVCHSILKTGQRVVIEVPGRASLVGTVQWLGLSSFGIKFDENTKRSDSLRSLLS